MNDTTKSDKLSVIVQELDNFLYEGYLLRTHTIDSWNLQSKDELNKPDANVFNNNFEKNINDWLNKVASFLVNNFAEKNLYFHFISPPTGLSFSYNHPLGRLSAALEKHLLALEEVIVRLEERKNLTIRKEIADTEAKADILYQIKFSPHTREIKLNEILLAKPNSDSKNLNFFEYVFAHPNERINMKDVEESAGMELAGNIQDILRDLGFVDKIRQVFFPVSTKKAVMFVNPISRQYAIENDLPTIQLKK